MIAFQGLFVKGDSNDYRDGLNYGPRLRAA